VDAPVSVGVGALFDWLRKVGDSQPRTGTPPPRVSERDRRLSRFRNADLPPQPISPVEYWAYLSAAALLTVLYLSPPLRRGETSRARTGPGAFGAFRSVNKRQTVQHLRTDEHGRGRNATAPWYIPARGWKDILWRTYRQTSEDRLLAVAAGVVFYGLLALFPAITAAVSLYGLFANAATINVHHSFAAGILPASAVDIIHEQIVRLTAKSDTKLGFAFVSGLAIALWSANAGMKAMMDALNIVYEEKEKRGFIKLNLISLAFTLGMIVLALLASGAVVVLPFILMDLGLAQVTNALFQYSRWPILLAVMIVGLATIYRFGPSRRHVRWQWLSIGTLVAAAAWIISSAFLSWYLATYAHYDVTYGSLGTGVGLMMWMWVSAIVILLGAQLNSEIEHQTTTDSTVERDRPLGERGAVMADTVGKAA
jgi:membrane protein